MNTVSSALAFLLIVVGAIFTFAVHSGNLDRADLGITLLVLGCLAFGLVATRLWAIEQHDPQSPFRQDFQLASRPQSKFSPDPEPTVGGRLVLNPQSGTRRRASPPFKDDAGTRFESEKVLVAASLGFVAVAFGALLTFAFYRGGLDSNALGPTLLVLGTPAFGLAASRQLVMDRRARWHERRRYVAGFFSLVVMSVCLVASGLILAFGSQSGGLVVGVVLLLFGGFAFVMATGKLWFADHRRRNRPTSISDDDWAKPDAAQDSGRRD